MNTWTTQQIADWTQGELRGPGDLPITGMQSMEEASSDELTYIGGAKFESKWQDCKASAAFVLSDSTLEAEAGRALIVVSDVDLATAIVLENIAPPVPQPPTGVHPSAVVDESAQVDPTAAIGPNCVVGPRAVIGANVVMQPNSTVMDDAIIGAGTVLWPGAVVRERCEIGERCILHLNSSIGADGFGFRPSADGNGLVKVPQIGIVRLGNDVEIGANTSIDRAKFGVTELGDSCKIDNGIQIGHNCKLGRCVIMAGHSGLAGSIEVGDGAIIGGKASILDHTKIGTGAKIGAFSFVMTDVPAGETYLGYPAKSATMTLKEWAAVKRLPKLLKRLKGKE